MAGLAQKSRPVQGDGNFIVPSEHRLHPKISKVSRKSSVIIPTLFELKPKITNVKIPLSVPILKSTVNLFPKIDSQKSHIHGLFKKSTVEPNQFLKGLTEPNPNDFLQSVTKAYSGNLYMYGTDAMTVLGAEGNGWFQSTATSNFSWIWGFDRPVKIKGFYFKWGLTGNNLNKMPRRLSLYKVEEDNSNTLLDTFSFAGDSDYRNITKIFFPNGETPDSTRFRVTFSGEVGYIGLEYFIFF
tara:strand:- start:1283 stop:2005 length:723 start_codon:yes stop_codon:yes gene_type:complete